jgi:hypothetical protein
MKSTQPETILVHKTARSRIQISVMLLSPSRFAASCDIRKNEKDMRSIIWIGQTSMGTKKLGNICKV